MSDCWRASNYFSCLNWWRCLCPAGRTQAVERADAADHPAADGVVGQRVKHAAEGTGTCSCPNQVLQDQVPANEERHKLPHGHVAVGVGRARGLGDAHAELSVANTWLEREEEV